MFRRCRSAAGLAFWAAMDEERGGIVGDARSREGRENASQALLASPARQVPLGPVRRSRLRPLLWLLVIAGIVGAAIWYLPHAAKQPQTGRFGQPGAPIPVGVAAAQTGDMPVMLSGLGTVTPLATVTVKTQINGYLVAVGFSEGQHVKKGEFLAQIDPRPYQVALELAQAQLAKDQASLKNAELDLRRYDTLVAQNSIATQTRDTQAATVAQDRAQVLLDQAQIDTQKLNLTYCHIVSPVTGRVGLRQVDPGNYVQTSDPNGIVVVTELQPISVIFTLPEDDLPQVVTQLHAGTPLPATADDRTGTTKIATGKLETIDNQIDPTTGTVKLRAIFDNADETLFPNQFVNIKLLVRTLSDTVIVPVAAIERGAPGTFVYRALPNHTVAVQKVSLGPGDGQKVAILSGLNRGDLVVDDGADRLKDGAKISIVAPPGSTAGAGAAAAPSGHAARHARGHRAGGARPQTE
jgi:multidrug efflux system membrane fusion protein